MSVTLIQDGAATTAAFTGPVALHLDETQYDAGYGPCLDAGRASATVTIEDMATEDRWPQFTARALEQGVRSSMSVSLPVQHAITGALNIYAVQTRAFDSESVDLAQSFASYAAVALANAHLYASTAATAGQMRAAMASRAVIEQAKGVLIARHGCTPDEAFAMLSKASQFSNRKLRDLAEEIVTDTGARSRASA